MKQRLSAFLLVLIMIFTAIPVTVFAAEAEPVLSVFVASDRHGSDTNLTSILEVIAEEGYAHLEASLLDGDTFDGSSKNPGKRSSRSSSVFYSTDSVSATIQGILGADVACYYTYGTHDGTDNATTFLQGAVDLGEAYLYGITYSQVSSATIAKTAAADFTAWIESLDAEEAEKPVIIASHMPLHARRGDNKGASVWLSALNEAGGDHTLIFLWGHNHTGESSVDTDVYFVEKGGSITAYGDDTATEITFTYMNAGYLKLGYGSVISICADGSVIVDRFSTSAKTATYEIAGNSTPIVIPAYAVTVQSRITGTNDSIGTVSGGGDRISGKNGTVLTASAVDGYVFSGWYTDYTADNNGTLLSSDATYAFIPDSDITVTAVYVKTKTLSVYYVDDAAVPVSLKEATQISGCIGQNYTVTPEAIYGYTTPAAVSGTYTEASEDITLVYVLNTDKSALKALLDNPVAKDGYTEESYAVYEAALEDGQTVYDTERATQTEVDTVKNAIDTAVNNLKAETVNTGYTLDTDSIDSGAEYVIVCSGKALGVTSGSITAASVTVSDNTIDEIDDGYVWIVTKTSSGYTLENKSTGQYLAVKTSGFFNSSRTLSVSSSSFNWNVSTSGSNRKFYRTYSGRKYYLYYASKFKLSTSSSNLLIYKKNS